MAYLDNSATTPPFDHVIERMSQCMREGYYNPSSMYAPAADVAETIDETRRLLLHHVGMPGGEVCFTSGGTEADNIAIMGAVFALRGRPGHVVTTTIEHAAVLGAARALEAMDVKVDYIAPDKSGFVDPYAIADAVSEETTLVSVMHVNNEVGTIQRVEEIARLVKRKSSQTLFHVDGVQAYLRVPIHMGRALIDMYSVSAHKVNGPKGIGALVIRKGVNLLPLIFGGGQEDGLRPGTENVPGIVGFNAAHQGYVAGELVAATLRDLKMQLYHGLQEADVDMLYNGPPPGQGAPHILNVSFPGVKGEVLLHALEAEHVYVSTGAACSARRNKPSYVLKAIGCTPDRLDAAIRFSLSPLNTGVDVDEAVAAIKKCVKTLRAFRRK